MREPDWEDELPGWEDKHGDEYKLRYYRRHIGIMLPSLERKRDEIRHYKEAYWEKIRTALDDVSNGEKCICMPMEIVLVNN